MTTVKNVNSIDISSYLKHIGKIGNPKFQLIQTFFELALQSVAGSS